MARGRLTARGLRHIRRPGRHRQPPVTAARRPRSPATGASLLAVAALAAGLLAGCGGNSGGDGVVAISAGGCGGRWHLPGPGWHTFQVRNDSTAAAEVDLVSPASGAVYGEVDAVGPGTAAPLRVNVGSGSYAFRCLLEDTDPITGPVVRVGGHARGAPGVLPVTAADLLGPAKAYHRYVAAGLDALVRQAGTLAASIRAGDLAAARRAWLPAHLTYERLGAAYGTFGDYDGKIDGPADGLPGGLADPGFTGFYRIEYGLWHGQGAGRLAGPAERLDRDARALRSAWPRMQVDLLDLGLRTHEILENALQFQLTGHDDYGSGTTLATTQANITGTRELLTVLHRLLVPRYREMPSVYASLDRLQAQLAAARRPGGWTPAAKLTTARRERIDAAAGQALTALAPIAVIFEPRRT